MENKKSKKIIVITAIIFIVVVLGIIFIIMNLNKNDKPKSDNEISIEDNDNITDENENDETIIELSEEEKQFLELITPVFEEQVGDIGKRSIILYADDTLVTYGTEKQIKFTVRLYPDIFEYASNNSIVIVDENDKSLNGIRLTDLVDDVAYYEFPIQYRYKPEDDKGMTCYAKIGDYVSDPLDFYVTYDLQPEDLVEVIDTGLDLQKYLDDNKIEEKEESVILNEVQKWLLADDRIEYAEISGLCVLYGTKKHAAGIYILPGLDGTLAGGGGGNHRNYANGTVNIPRVGNIPVAGLDDVFYQYVKSDGNFKYDKYLDGINSITNNKWRLLLPAHSNTHDDDGALLGIRTQDYPVTTAGDHYSEFVDKYSDWNKVVNQDDAAVYSILVDGLGDSGLVNMICHGAYFKRTNGGYTSLYKFFDITPNPSIATDKDTSSAIKKRIYEYLGEDVYKMLSANRDFDKCLLFFEKGRLICSSNAIKQANQNVFFDNTIFYIGACYGILDDSLVSLFLDHGMKAVIGWKTVAQQNIQQHTYDKFHTNLLDENIKGNTTLSLKDIYAPRNILYNPVEYFENTSDYIEKLMDSERHDLSNPSSSLFSAYVEYRNDNFTIKNYSNTVSGKLVAMNYDVTVHLDGSKSIIEHSNIPKDVNLDLYHYMNRTFENDGTATKSDANGNFSFNNVRWGLYGLDIHSDNYTEKFVGFSSSFDIENLETIKLQKYGASIQGYVNYTKVLSVDENGKDISNTIEYKNKSKPVPNSNVRFTLKEPESWEDEGFIETVYTTKTDSNGKFVMENIPGGRYSIQFDYINCNDNECNETKWLTLENGNSYVYEKPFYCIDNFVKVIQAAGGRYHIAVLREDGTVVVKGNDFDGQTHTESWSDIVGVYCGEFSTGGIKSDGTCVYAGINYFGEKEGVESWTNIKKLAMGELWVVGLKEDGTCVAVGNNEYGQCNVGKWENIVDIQTFGDCTVGLTSDGRILLAGEDNDRGTRTETAATWSDIVKIETGYHHIIGIKSDGSAVGTVPDVERTVNGNLIYHVGYNEFKEMNDKASKMHDIIDVADHQEKIAILHKDGTVSVIVSESKKELECYTVISTWKDIVDIEASQKCFIGINSKGELFVAGSPSHHEENKILDVANVRK